ncbi:hypothetical protein MBLNU457_g3055t1 [Dothideomycetes sp. NU457]
MDAQDQSFEMSEFDEARFDDQQEHTSNQHGNDRNPDSSSSLHFSDAIDSSHLESEDGHSIDEREMRRQLNDVESSFLPESIPAQSTGQRIGADDTYVNMAATDRPPSLRALMGMPLRSASSQRFAEAYERGTSYQSQDYRPQPEQGYDDGDGRELEQDQEYEHNEGDEGYEEERESTTQDPGDMPSIEGEPSSPAAAAAHRNLSRNAPSSISRPSTARIVEDSIPSRSSSISSRPGASHSLQRPESSRSTNRARSPLPQDISLPASEQFSTTSSASALRSRPNLEHNRQISNTSYGGYSDVSGSDVTISADYALHTGGAAPADSSLAHRPNASLSRLPSLGRVVSVMERDEDAGMPSFNRGMSSMSTLGSLRSERRLDPLDEERSSLASSPATPRANSALLPGITDTAITRHVQNIRVPDTVAQEFRQRQPSFSPDKRPFSSSASISSRPQSNLTLKEQNSKIDKLTKENFDLKLKIHFLDQALQNRSDEGVKDMINQNVQFQTDLTNERKESQSLRRRIRELEKRLREVEEELTDTKENAANTYLSSHQEMEIEINELRQQLDFSQVRITKLSAENLANELEKRKMAEYVAAMRERPTSRENPSADEADMWKDLLETETARREQAEDDVRKLKEQLLLLKTERSSADRSSTRPERRDRGHTTSWSGFSEGTHSRNGAVSGSSITLVEQLRLENIELRRDLGAQTSMLTSRNKERERLQQEIEDLKITSRKGDTRSLAGDSILERSASRARQRSSSRFSARTAASHVNEAERDEYEKREGMLRDQSAQLRLDYRDLEREAQARMDYINQLEVDLKATEDDLASAVEDLKSLQKERDDALRALEYRDSEYEKLMDEYKRLEEEALTNIEGLEDNIQLTERSRQQLTVELKDRNEDFAALQQELRALGTKMLQIEDDREVSLKRIRKLEHDLEDATQEVDLLERRLHETGEKNQRLEVTQESMQNEITFLREEQEVDKVKIGDLQNTLSAAQQAVRDEKDKMQELEDNLLEERRQRDIIDNQSKQDVQKVINELNDDNTKNKDEIRRLRRNLSSKENEADTIRSRLEELESNLQHALGDPNGSHTSLLQDIERLQDDLDGTAQQLDEARAIIADKDRLIKNRDALLESTGLESRRFSDLLDKERQARKHDQHQYDQSQRGSATHLRAIANHETKIMELETARGQDRRKLNNLERQWREQLDERNKLLLSLWTRLSTLCGAEWVQQHKLVNGEVPSADSISRELAPFNRNIVEAIKQIEVLVGGFKTKIRGVEKSLLQDYQTLEHTLDARVKRMEALERSVQDTQAQIDAQRAEEMNRLRPTVSRSPSIGEDGRRRLSKANTEELNKLRIEVKTLRTELKFHRQQSSNLGQEKLAQEAAAVANRRSSTIGTGASSTGSASKVSQAIANKLLRHHSTSAVDVLHQAKADADNGTSTNRQPIVIATPPIQPSEQRWVHRLKELERRLKAEREARLLDRRGARQRLEEKSAENQELKGQLERERDRAGSIISLSELSPDEMAGARQQHTDVGAELEEGSVHRRQRDRSVD